MKKDWLLWIAIAAGLIALGGTAAVVYTGARGIRNNNPGNIRKGTSQWQGMSPQQTDSAFVQFVNPVYGIRALAVLLKNYQSRYGLNTVEGLISRYAPPNENITGSYVKAVANAIGVDARQPINVEQHLPGLVAAITKHENGMQPYPESLIREGVSLA